MQRLGATGLMMQKPDDIVPMMKKSFDPQGPVVVGVDFDHTDNHELFEMVQGDAFQQEIRSRRGAAPV